MRAYKFRVVSLVLFLASFLATAGELNRNSVYQLPGTWKTQEGKSIGLPELRGRPLILSMVYTNCEYSCPLTIEYIKKILRALSPEAQEKVGVALFSFDPEKDTPSRLKMAADQKNLSSKTWTLLQGNEDTVRSISTILGVNYKKLEKGVFSHSNVIVVVDAEGVVQFRQPGLGADPKEAARALEKLLKL